MSYKLKREENLLKRTRSAIVKDNGRGSILREYKVWFQIKIRSGNNKTFGDKINLSNSQKLGVFYVKF
jgi:hypothetical protein